LQSASDLSTNGGWTPVVATTINTNGQYVVTNSPSNGQMFYRLAR
jgi:hypothetical protein